MSIHPYFRVMDGKMDKFKDLCEQLVSLAANEPKCFYYGFSFHADEAYCREAYEGAEGLLAHLENVASPLQELLKISEIFRLEVHGADEELAKLSGPLSAYSPTYFTLEYGVRR